MKKIYLLLILIIVLFIAGCGLSNQGTGNVVKEIPPANTIEFTNGGLNPSDLIINQGDKITWLNKDDSGTEYWPASAMHPTHTVYPGSDIKKCGTSEEKNIFDLCRGLKQGESFSFTFNEKGIWGYHDHLNPKLHGKITVN
ncbi:MAG: hypothetical protein AABX61_00550 [Nanoarchaeota archaeon]